MSLRATFLGIGAALAALIISSLAVMAALQRNIRAIEKAEERRHHAFVLADRLHQSSDDLSRMARTYVVTEDPRFEEYFNTVLRIRNGESPRPANYDGIYWDLVTGGIQDPQEDGEAVSLEALMRRAGFSEAEFEKLREAQRESDTLARLEERAMALVKGLYPDERGAYVVPGEPDPATARALLHGPDYHQTKARIMAPIGEFHGLVDERTAVEVAALRASGDRLMVAAIALVVVSLFFLGFAAVVVHYRAAMPVQQLERGAKAVEQGRQPQLAIRRDDELGRLMHAFNRMSAAIQADIERRERSQRELEAAKQKAEEATIAKSAFLANMSHEIRTPMNGVLGMAELMAQTELDPRQRTFVDVIVKSGNALLTIINDILDFSKIEAGRIELDPVEFLLRDSISDTLSPLSLRSAAKGVELAYDVHPDVPDALIGDVYRLRQVLVNLVGNAIKFTEKGEVVVSVGLVARDGDDATIEVRVRDTGIGITPEAAARLFKAFEQAEASTTRKYGGTGLGLAISKQLVELMGGRIRLESEPGVGSTFIFNIRMKVGEARPSVTVDDATRTLRGKSALIVDDNETNRRILGRMLEHWGLKTYEADGGKAGLTALDRAANAGRPVSLVVTDLHMPGMDGFEFTAAIRNHPTLGTVPIMLLTSSASAGDQDRCAELGVAARLLKPVKQSLLLDNVMRVLAGADRSRAMKSAPTPEPGAPIDGRADRAPLRVLLAEDNPVNQKFAVRVLEGAGHRVVVANNGREAVEHSGEQAFDIVLMDVQMPEMDGLDATRAIRTREGGSGRRLPIIAMTANAMQGDREMCLDAGMDGYVPKPVKKDVLFGEIDRVLTEAGRGADV